MKTMQEVVDIHGIKKLVHQLHKPWRRYIIYGAGVKILGSQLEFNTMEPLWYFRSPFEFTLLVRQEVVFSMVIPHNNAGIYHTYRKKGRTIYYDITVC